MKKLTIICITIMIMFISTASLSADTVPETENITIMPTVERPELQLLESLDDSAYVGGYWIGEVLHIIPVEDQANEIESAMASAITTYGTDMPEIVVDESQDLPAGIDNTYSMAEREAGKAYLLENQESLNIQAVGLTADKLAVFMNEGATETDKEAVLQASPVKAIEFFGELLPDDIFENEAESVPDEDDSDQSGVTPLATSTSLRGGNWARTSASYNWSTIGVSAVRNWNGSSGDIGFITCGHGWTNGQVVYASDGTRVGIADVRLYDNMDVTFVKLDNTSLNSHGYLKNGTQITKNTSISSVDINKSITKHGARTGTTSGTIKALNISGKWDNYFTNLILTSCTTRSGDSGCALVVNGNTIAGLMIGARSSSPVVGGTATDPIYGESVMLPISAVISGPKFLPST
ncbi:MAG: S1 family peptidase [Oscillospiraceae bacterium]|jgi:hypothetical protein|nr:S1 family peptidase [Oscillospiraceae bacterium]